MAFLLGIETSAQVSRDPLVGQLFENLIVIECLKSQANQGKMPNLYFYRDSNSNEVDVLYQQGRQLIAMEIKWSSTYQTHLLKSLKKMMTISENIKQGYLIYNGEALKFSDGIEALKFNQVAGVFQIKD